MSSLEIYWKKPKKTVAEAMNSRRIYGLEYKVSAVKMVEEEEMAVGPA